MTNNTAAPEDFSGKTVMVVDDGPIERLAGKSLLQKLGVTALVAASGEEALRMLRDQPVDLVVCDISMPGMSGLELLDATRGFSPAPRFIMVSSHNEADNAQASIERGAEAYVMKPLRFDSLRDTMAGVFANTSRGN